jgi:hypothetical protein
MAWGDAYIDEVRCCLRESLLPNCDRVLITDPKTCVKEGEFRVVRADFKRKGLFRKTELIRWLPEGYDSYLFIDSDTRVLVDIDLGFQKAEQYGIAVVPASHYSLDQFWGFGEVMQKEGVPLQGQLQFNSGVIFLSLREDVKKVLHLWSELGRKYDGTPYSDQPFLTLAMELMHFNPYALSPSYNYRAFGDLISGVIRIWHSRCALPDNINAFQEAWPPRRVLNDTLITPKIDRRFAKLLKNLRVTHSGVLKLLNFCRFRHTKPVKHGAAGGHRESQGQLL